MPVQRRPWDEEDDDRTPYGVSGEALPSRTDAVRDMDIGEEVVARPRRKKAELADDDAAEGEPVDPPVRKKKRKKRDLAVYAPDEDDERDKENETREWIITGALFAVGFVLMLVGAVGVSGKKDFEDVKSVTLIASCLLGVVISIPAILLGLTVGGSIIGIEYGTPLSAIRNIAAIALFCNGLDWIGLWAGVPLMMQMFSTLVAFSLFMSRFQLDVWEVWASAIAVQAVLFAVNVAMMLAMAGVLDKKGRSAAPDVTPPARIAMGLISEVLRSGVPV